MSASNDPDHFFQTRWVLFAIALVSSKYRAAFYLLAGIVHELEFVLIAVEPSVNPLPNRNAKPENLRTQKAPLSDCNQRSSLQLQIQAVKVKLC